MSTSSAGSSQQLSTTGTYGYICSCGAWVTPGLYHQCAQYPSTYIQPSWNWSYPVPQITSFKGAVETLDDLAQNAKTGDAYYIEKIEALVVRQAGGWFHFDRR